MCYVSNIIKIMKELDVKVSIEKRTSKAGNDYHVLVVRFKNGYKFESFLNNDQYFIINQMFINEN